MITSKQRAFLRSLANQIDTIVMIGKDGLSADIEKQAHDALTKRELIKCKVLETAGITSRQAAEALSKPLSAEVVQVIGNKFVLYRKNQKEPKIILPKAARR
ncbi:YhbY family RNA-binding protein [Clostridium minihomine]|uniref:YhbY family RNA-binding protein n=1 Tax=Clostridium minihomine TaxID=2045012 RepID=UPI000C75CE08|nr:YhbY family RNA-binding protein [Clostridium minihomine]